MTSIDPGAQIGHVHLQVADLDRAVSFYRDVLGFQLTGRIGDQLGFLAAGGYHHHVGLNTFESRAPARAAGLYHAAIRYPTPRGARARAAPRARPRPPGQPRLRPRRDGGRLPRPTPTATGSSSTGTARSRSGRARPTGALALVNLPLDLETLLSELSAEHEALGLVGRAADRGPRPRRALAPAAEHVGGDDVRVGRVRPADADPHAVEVRRAELALERLQPVVAGQAAAEPRRGSRRTAGRSRRAGRARGRGRA